MVDKYKFLMKIKFSLPIQIKLLNNCIKWTTVQRIHAQQFQHEFPNFCGTLNRLHFPFVQTQNSLSVSLFKKAGRQRNRHPLIMLTPQPLTIPPQRIVCEANCSDLCSMLDTPVQFTINRNRWGIGHPSELKRLNPYYSERSDAPGY